jgi:hypothetical protein
MAQGNQLFQQEMRPPGTFLGDDGLQCLKPFTGFLRVGVGRRQLGRGHGYSSFWCFLEFAGEGPGEPLCCLQHRPSLCFNLWQLFCIVI